ncbi:MAG: peptidase M48 [Desulfobulbus propionicus]|nr:MAG: peptidase M48 [Desulfobulbus propionicus]
MNGYLLFIVGIIITHSLLDLIVSLLNLRSLSPYLPKEFVGIYEEKEYGRSQDYTRVTTRFSLIENTVSTVAMLLFILLGGFNALDLFARSFHFPPVFTGLLFIGVLAFLTGALNLPFGIYSTFVIEERFGFNKTTVKTFILDLLKGVILSILLGAPLLGGILWFFEAVGTMAWLYCWGAVVLFSLVMQFLAPVVIMPLFNTFTPLEEGTLKENITSYAQEQKFGLKGIYTMNGSKRSTRANAFFTGFGPFRRIVFFDTLLNKITDAELLAILAHEMGHYKKKHIFKMLAASTLQTGIMFYILSFFLDNQRLFAAFGMEHLSIYAGLVFFSFLYSPISTLLSIAFNVVSRKHEYEADAFAAETTGLADSLISGLKKLSVTNLSNLTPHPLNVLLNYSHPPVLDRIKALKTGEDGG